MAYVAEDPVVVNPVQTNHDEAEDVALNLRHQRQHSRTNFGVLPDTRQPELDCQQSDGDRHHRVAKKNEPFKLQAAYSADRIDGCRRRCAGPRVMGIVRLSVAHASFLRHASRSTT